MAARRAADRRLGRRDRGDRRDRGRRPRAWSSCPALTGLGAPHWDPHARGLIIGITRGTTRAHIVRATLEAIAFEVRDVLETMPNRRRAAARRRRRLGQRPALPAPGRPGRRRGASGPKLVETTALGAAFLAGLGTGVWSSTDDLRETWQLDRTFTPAADRTAADAAHARWIDAVERSKGWAAGIVRDDRVAARDVWRRRASRTIRSSLARPSRRRRGPGWPR